MVRKLIEDNLWLLSITNIMSLLSNIFIIITTLIYGGYCQCTLNEYIDKSYCGSPNINVYGSIPLENNDAKKWRTEAAKTSAQWLFGGIALSGLIPGPAAGIINAGIGNLAAGILGTAGDENADLINHQQFETAVNNAFENLIECINNKVKSEDVEDELEEIWGFLDRYMERSYDNIVAGSLSDAKAVIDDFERLFDDVSGFIASNFNDLSIEYRKRDENFLDELPVFNAILGTYDTIASSYLNFLEECKFHDNYAEIRQLCPVYRYDLDTAQTRIFQLVDWINAALPSIIDSYDIAEINSLNLKDTDYKEYREIRATTRTGYLTKFEFGRNKNDDAYLAVGNDDDPWSSYSAEFKLTVDMFGSKDCVLRENQYCKTWLDGVQNKDEKTTEQCRNNLFNILSDQYEDYRDEVESWIDDFNEQYVDRAYELKKKINELVATPDRSEYIGCYTDDGSSRALPYGGVRGHTWDTCSEYCRDYTLFAIQSRDQCWCGFDIENAIQYGTSTGCTSIYTGGSWAFSLFTHRMYCV